ncbi:hypothetical protein R1sor_016990 [Riccia sorocarpa]|uniref:Reverse transcriptase zinc-binding domain-containing protein n=1 Tax=Riccia sorocarpa TaxID=122646 RepID=A0ABD3I5K0_9MARC
MDVNILKRPEALEQMKTTWEEHPIWAQEARRRWYLALGRIRFGGSGKFMSSVSVELERRGAKKAALIAWDQLAQSKEEGGIGWIPIKEKAMAMQVRTMVQLLLGGTAEWSQLAKSLVLRTLRHGQYQRERSQWSATDGLILLPLGKIKGSSYLSRMVRTWNRVCHMIKWSATCLEIPSHFTIAQGIHLMCWDNQEEFKMYGKAIAALRKVGVHSVQEGKQWSATTGTWRTKMAQVGVFLEEQDAAKLETMESWISSRTPVNKQIQEIQGWQWRDGNAPFEWIYPTRFWTGKFKKTQDFTTLLKEKWGIISAADSWSSRWRKLWAAALSYRRKIWLWRFFQRGIFTGNRGKNWSKQERTCQWCSTHEETIKHGLWECNRLNMRQQELKEVGLIPASCQNLIEWFDAALQWSGTNPSYLWGLAIYLTQVWSERNELKHRSKRSRLPTEKLLQQAALEIDSFPHDHTSNGSLTQLSKAKETVTAWKNTWARSRRPDRINDEVDADASTTTPTTGSEEEVQEEQETSLTVDAPSSSDESSSSGPSGSTSSAETGNRRQSHTRQTWGHDE